MCFSYYIRGFAQSLKIQAAPRKKTISYADDDEEEDSFKIRSGRRRHDEVIRGKFGRVYSHGEFVPPCILCISSGGSFRSSENQEITEKVERGNMCKRKRERRRETGGREGGRKREREEEKRNGSARDERTRNQILSFSGEGSRVEISRGTKSKLVFVRYSLARSPGSSSSLPSLSSLSSSTSSST